MKNQKSCLKHHAEGLPRGTSPYQGERWTVIRYDYLSEKCYWESVAFGGEIRLPSAINGNR